MENWKFLIQQEGDREWLPLDLPESEILEGRYRLVGQSQLQQHPVQIHLVYHDLDGAAAPRDHRRAGQTNAQGLIGIFPFTRLQPGLWEIMCRLGAHTVALHLQVVPHDGGSELDSELDLLGLSALHADAGRTAAAIGNSDEPPLPVPAADSPMDPKTPPAPAPSPEEALASVAGLFETVEAMADQVISAIAERMTEDRALEEAAARLIGSPRTAAPPPDLPIAPSPQAPILPATIQLHASAYTLYRDRPLTLKGTVSGPEDIAALPASLTLTLIDPQTGAAIASQTSPEAITRLPQAFNWDLDLSLPPQTQLVLARLSLRPDATDSPWPLADCSFAVMVLSEQAQPEANPFAPVPTAGPLSPVELPPFLQDSATVPPEAKAAALAKVAELSAHQETQAAQGADQPSDRLLTEADSTASGMVGSRGTPAVDSGPPEAGESEDGAANPFHYPDLSED